MKGYKIGDRVRVELSCSGIDSGKIGTVIKPIDWRKISGMYCEPKLTHEICIQYDDKFGRPDKIGYMFINRIDKYPIQTESYVEYPINTTPPLSYRREYLNGLIGLIRRKNRLTSINLTTVAGTIYGAKLIFTMNDLSRYVTYMSTHAAALAFVERTFPALRESMQINLLVDVRDVCPIDMKEYRIAVEYNKECAEMRRYMKAKKPIKKSA